jgi:hypothetical protein
MLTTCEEPLNDASNVAPAVATEPPGDDPDATFTVAIGPVGDDSDVALTDAEEEAPEATADNGAKLAPQLCEVAPTGKNRGPQPSVSDGNPNWLSESNEED